ncbi:MAG: YraN family protein [Omnitrophica bacterium RIFCSPLOWO2_12_FULL_44_17]|uniref:UPF0102 protein A3G33_09450 n=1 Tax=Candidatus Danuiimicrobium aquiferis TaxID=1801832 RepID=A0A1G1KX73_9BACT|nr:MAG: YraN family protein [Omnitrophica bacterium RIFCSPHIGHO2_02_FULL_45_28]OGW91063.1 MAG: YraN family protein [Omnitrophica bacterium RIFCSPHIGHO2_12_FULL_44_12]OGW97487.1 MAG: YraN family protein [Omnitrophica bacterium RIFCSPLOWO2_12_FULL_44_17]OGX04539.1 MAG: YraN family protein [Omnitrophica bacterium RIFCSPLOWO2_02_FULL_44_11]
MKHDLKETGNLGEDIATEYLKRRGYKIIQRNCRSPFGEIDLVAQDGNTLVFVEVKTRHGCEFGFPEEAVHQKKREQLIRLATWYLMKHTKKEMPVRFDILAVELKTGEPEIRLIQNAIEVE